MGSNSNPNKAPGLSAFNHEEMTREQTSPLLLESEEWAGTLALQPHGEGLCWVPVLSQPGSRPVPLSACGAGMCQTACICKMWACRAGRRKFPLKHLIFKRNEARASKHEQRARHARQSSCLNMNQTRVTLFGLGANLLQTE